MSPYGDKVAIVTGAASGIGAALVQGLLDRGAVVVAADVDAAGLEKLSPHDRLTTRPLDVTSATEVQRAFDQVAAEHGRIDYAFNNAGIVAGGSFEEMDHATWHRVMDVNFWGVVHGTQAAYAHMLRQGSGHIVNTASSAGVLPLARSVAYAASKHAVVGLSTSLRAEAAGTGVRVSVALPGTVDTPIFERALSVGGYDYERAIRRVPFAKVSPARAAAYILDGTARNRPFITFPAYNQLLVGLHRIAPGLMSGVINR